MKVALVINNISELKNVKINSYDYILDLALNETRQSLQDSNLDLNKIIFPNDLIEQKSFYKEIDDKVNELILSLSEDDCIKDINDFGINVVDFNRENFFWYFYDYFSKKVVLEKFYKEYQCILCYNVKRKIERLSNFTDVEYIITEICHEAKINYPFYYVLLNNLLYIGCILYYQFCTFINYSFTKFKSLFLHKHKCVNYKDVKKIVTPYSFTTKKVADNLIFNNFVDSKDNSCIKIDEVEPNFKISVFENKWNRKESNYFVFSEFINYKYYIKVVFMEIKLIKSYIMFRLKRPAFFSKKKILYYYHTLFKTNIRNILICQNIADKLDNVDTIIAFKTRPGILKVLVEYTEFKNNVKRIKIPHGIYRDSCYWNKVDVDYIVLRNLYMYNMFLKRGNDAKRLILLGERVENKVDIPCSEESDTILLFTRPADSLKLSDPINMYYVTLYKYIINQMRCKNVHKLYIKLHPREDKYQVKNIITSIDNNYDFEFIDDNKIKYKMNSSKYIISVKSSIIFELINYNKVINILDFWNEESLCNIEELGIINVLGNRNSQIVNSLGIVLNINKNAYFTEYNYEAERYIKQLLCNNHNMSY